MDDLFHALPRLPALLKIPFYGITTHDLFAIITPGRCIGFIQQCTWHADEGHPGVRQGGENLSQAHWAAKIRGVNEQRDNIPATEMPIS